MEVPCFGFEGTILELDPDFQYWFGCRYLGTEDTEKDPNLIFEDYVEEIRQDVLSGCFFDEFYYEDRVRNLDFAFTCFEKSAAKNHAKAQYILGLIYFNGIEGMVEANRELGMEYFQKAAAQNYPAAQYYLGNMYLNGEGTEKKPEEALRYFEMAAAQNHPEAQYNLGRIYFNGIEGEVEANRNLGMEYFQKAADNGNQNAIRFMEQLQRRQQLKNANNSFTTSFNNYIRFKVNI